jgi:2-succinyl-6-hydroxy-2,4-cyclohexadiene-1-carboxylate synthase
MNILADLPMVTLADGLTGRIQPGKGDKILWLHGYTVDSSMWGDMWRRLPGWHHIGIDFPGHGGSAPVAQMGDLATLGRRLGHWCIAQEIRHIVAISFGTITAIQIAMEFPSDFSTVVLSAPSLAGGPQEAEIAQVYIKLFQLYYQSGPGPHMRETWMGCSVWRGIDKVPGVREALASLVDQHSWAELQGFGIQRFTQPTQEKSAIERIQSAVLVMIGERELPAFRTVAQTLQQVVPRCQLLEFADSDHLCMMQNPAATARAIETHIRGHAVHPPA